MTLGQHIYTLRSEKHLSQGELSDLLGVSRQSVSKWENDTAVPDLDKLIRLCDIFSVSLDELTGRTIRTPAQAGDVTPTPVTDPNISSPTQKVLGYILLTFACLAAFGFIALRANLSMFIMFVQPLAFCGLICLLVNRYVGYWCLWAVYLSIEYTATFVVGLSLLKSTLLIRFIFIVFMIFVAWVIFKGVKISIPKNRGYLILLGWILYFAISWFLPRFFYLFPTRLWFAHTDMSQMLLYYLFNALATVGLAFLFRDTICFLRSYKRS